MTGWRVGFAAGPSDIIDKMLAVHQHLVSSPCAFAQKGAVKAFTEARSAVLDMVSAYRNRRKILLEGLGELAPIQFIPPEGACFFFVHFPAAQESSEELSAHFLDNAHLGLTPGSAFGDAGEGYLRLSFAGVSKEKLPEVLMRLDKGIKRLGI